ncbi:hypothetical protein FM106_30535 [Brachybacterium faecium]|nr:hypothetical protein FM106_30535 [Brachybacterium faecium]
MHPLAPGQHTSPYTGTCAGTAPLDARRVGRCRHGASRPEGGAVSAWSVASCGRSGSACRAGVSSRPIVEMTGGRRGSPAYSVRVSPARLETRTDPLQTSPLTPTTQRGGGAV